MSTIVGEIVRAAYSINPLQLAYHEAGHAIVAHRCGRRVSRLTIDTHGGLTTSDGPSSPLILLLVTIAGGRAEALTPGCIEELVGFPASQDDDDARLALDLIASGPTAEWIAKDARRQVDALLTNERDLLDRIGRTLLRRQSLGVSELEALLR